MIITVWQRGHGGGKPALCGIFPVDNLAPGKRCIMENYDHITRLPLLKSG